MAGMLERVIANLTAALFAWLSRSGLSRWKRRHPQLIEGLVVKSCDDLPPSYLFEARPRSQSPSPLSRFAEYTEWGKAEGAAYADKIILSFMLSSEQATRIHGLRVMVPTARPSLRWWVYRAPGMGGSCGKYTLSTSLDSAGTSGQAVVEMTKSDDDGLTTSDWSWPHSINADDPLWIELVVSADEGCYEWYVEIEYSIPGDRRRRTVREPRRNNWISSSSEGCHPLEGSWGS